MGKCRVLMCSPLLGLLVLTGGPGAAGKTESASAEAVASPRVEQEPQAPEPVADQEEMRLRIYDIRDLITPARSELPRPDEVVEVVHGGSRAEGPEQAVGLRAYRLTPAARSAKLEKLRPGSEQMVRLLAGILPGAQVGPLADDVPLEPGAARKRPRLFFRGGNPGDLIITATPRQHGRIEQLLREMRSRTLVQVNVETRAILLRPSLVSDEAACPLKWLSSPQDVPEGWTIPGPGCFVAEDPASFQDFLAWCRGQGEGVEIVATPVMTIRSAERPPPVAPPATEVCATVLPNRKDVFVRTAVKACEESDLEVYSVCAVVPDGAVLVAVEDGPLAAAVASVWLGEERARDVDLEDCAIVFAIRARIVLLVEEEPVTF